MFCYWKVLERGSYLNQFGRERTEHSKYRGPGCFSLRLYEGCRAVLACSAGRRWLINKVTSALHGCCRLNNTQHPQKYCDTALHSTTGNAPSLRAMVEAPRGGANDCCHVLITEDASESLHGPSQQWGVANGQWGCEQWGVWLIRWCLYGRSQQCRAVRTAPHPPPPCPSSGQWGVDDM